MTAVKHTPTVSDFTAFLHDTKRYQQYTKLISRVAETQGEHFTRYENILLKWDAKSFGDAIVVDTLKGSYQPSVKDARR